MRSDNVEATRQVLDMPAFAAQPPVFELADIPVHGQSRDEAVRLIVSRRGLPTGSDVHFINSFSFACAADMRTVHEALRRSSLNFADGIGVKLAASLLGSSLPARLPGPDLMATLLDSERHARHFFLGSTESTLERLVSNLRRRYPGIVIAGTESPPFRSLTDEERADQVRRIKASSPDYVWVGLGTPKQDVEASWLAEQIPAVVLAVGAAFDFIAGTQVRAPGWVRRAGLEWIFRLATEPRRLWRRYLFGNVRFGRITIVERRRRMRAK